MTEILSYKIIFVYRSHTVPKKEGHAEAHAAKLSPEEARIAEVMEHITKIEKSLGIDAQ